jgi:hypothetical protein
VINITVLAGMCVRKSIISLHRYSRADARTKNIRNCEHVPTDFVELAGPVRSRR